jgi:hypothetical protein
MRKNKRCAPRRQDCRDGRADKNSPAKEAAFEHLSLGDVTRRRNEDSHDWQSYVHHHPSCRFCSRLLGGAGTCGQARWKLEHGRRHYPRPLRDHRDWPRNRPRPHFFHRRIFRVLPDQVGRPRFNLGACPDECRGGPPHRPWERTVRPTSGERDLGRSRALRSLLRRLERRSLLIPGVVSRACSSRLLMVSCRGSSPCIARGSGWGSLVALTSKGPERHRLRATLAWCGRSRA